MKAWFYALSWWICFILRLKANPRPVTMRHSSFSGISKEILKCLPMSCHNSNSKPSFSCGQSPWLYCPVFFCCLLLVTAAFRLSFSLDWRMPSGESCACLAFPQCSYCPQESNSISAFFCFSFALSWFECELSPIDSTHVWILGPQLLALFLENQKL